jgi:hypothetical protein
MLQALEKQWKGIRIHGGEPLVFLAFEMGVCSKAKNGLSPEGCFVRLLNTITEPPRYLISTAEEEVDNRARQTSMGADIDQSSSRAFCIVLACSLQAHVSFISTNLFFPSIRDGHCVKTRYTKFQVDRIYTLPIETCKKC